MHPLRTAPIAPLLALVLIGAGAGLAGCGGGAVPTPPSDQPRVLPAGRGNFAAVEDELVLDDLIGQRLELPYNLATSAADGRERIRWRVALTPTPLDPPERCGMTVVALVAVHADGRTTEVPASGTVRDNSDGQPGFRVELARRDRSKLAIPAGASATVVFSAPVTLPKL